MLKCARAWFTPLVRVQLRVTPQNNSHGRALANHHAARAAAAKQSACGVGVLERHGQSRTRWAVPNEGAGGAVSASVHEAAHIPNRFRPDGDSRLRW